jgi:hypothetical protein
MRVVYHRFAETEVKAARYYEQKSSGLGAQFLDAIDETAKHIQQNPEWFEIVEDDVRRTAVKRFPYSVFFRIIVDMVRILAVKHHSRNSTYWKRRH